MLTSYPQQSSFLPQATDFPEYTVAVTQIAGLETIGKENQHPPRPVQQQYPSYQNAPPPVPPHTSNNGFTIVPPPYGAGSIPHHPQPQNTQPSGARPAKKFEDPAILSMARPGSRPSIQTTSSTVSGVPQVAIELPAAPRSHQEAIEAIPEVVPTNFEAPKSAISPAAVLVEPVNGLSIGDPINIKDEEDVEAEEALPLATRKKRRQPKRRARKEAILENDGQVTPTKDTVQSKGWRQTPLLEPTPSFQPFATLKRKSQTQTNGWATEDASDVQDMGEFDFASNLSKFDKRGVFDQIKAEDMTADEDRLVSHNRLPKPGTAGGKNLHHSENVLDMPSTAAVEWNSEASDNEELRHNSGSGRNSRRAESRLSAVRKQQPRKLSSQNAGPIRVQVTAPQQTTPKAAFYLVPSNRKCEVVSPLQMLNLENIADNELGLTEDMMAENAARGVSEVALSALDGGVRRLTQDENATIQTVVVFAGNNKSGLRAVAAGRHLRNHGIQVVVCVLGLEREPELLDGLRRQLKIFKNFGGKVLTKSELMEWTKTISANIDLIIDGLLGLTISFEELRTGDQATAYELIEWTNRAKIPVLAIDVPTGIDPTNGKLSIVDGNPLYLHTKYVVAMGAPKRGLLLSMAAGADMAAAQVFVADLGLGERAWRKAGTRLRRGVEFGREWIVGLRFQGVA